MNNPVTIITAVVVVVAVLSTAVSCTIIVLVVILRRRKEKNSHQVQDAQIAEFDMNGPVYAGMHEDYYASKLLDCKYPYLCILWVDACCFMCGKVL